MLVKIKARKKINLKQPSKAKKLFASNLKFLRKKKLLSQKKLASNINCDMVTIRYYEAGLRWPRSEVLDAVSKFFNVPIAHLFRERK